MIYQSRYKHRGNVTHELVYDLTSPKPFFYMNGPTSNVVRMDLLRTFSKIKHSVRIYYYTNSLGDFSEGEKFCFLMNENHRLFWNHFLCWWFIRKCHIIRVAEFTCVRLRPYRENFRNLLALGELFWKTFSSAGKCSFTDRYWFVCINVNKDPYRD